MSIGVSAMKFKHLIAVVGLWAAPSVAFADLAEADRLYSLRGGSEANTAAAIAEYKSALPSLSASQKTPRMKEKDHELFPQFILCYPMLSLLMSLSV